MKIYRIVFIFLLSAQLVAQQKSAVLAKINKTPITLEEFKKVYEKNLDVITTEEGKDLEKTLQLYIDFKLKVQQAYQLQLDTLPAIVKEITSYKNQLARPYLRDETYIDTLLEEAYYRTKHEIRARHILIGLPKNYTARDTLKAYTTIMKARAAILKGEPFEKVAQRVSEDPSVKDNGGDLGYFGAFKMVYPFEDAAYKTPLGNVSMPFRTSFGYHIVKTTEERLSKGERTVAHIFIADNSALSKQKADSIYQKLKAGEAFATLAMRYSNDLNSKTKGGVLPKFGTGRMVKAFEDAAFSLTKPNQFSKPIQTRYGWHIIQLKEIHPIGSFEAMKSELLDKIKGSNRMDLTDKAMIAKLKKQYTISPTEALQKALNDPNFAQKPKDSLQHVLFTIDNKKVYAYSFASFLKYRRAKSTLELYADFVDQEIILYFKSQLMKTAPKYAADVREFTEGVLLFELLKTKIWDVATQDSIGLRSFYEQHKLKYEGKPLKEVKGRVISEFQTALEEQWVVDLRKNANIKIYTHQLKKLKTFYRKEE